MDVSFIYFCFVYKLVKYLPNLNDIPAYSDYVCHNLTLK